MMNFESFKIYHSSFKITNGVIAQLAEHLFCKQKDVSSNLIDSTIFSLIVQLDRTEDYESSDWGSSPYKATE